MISDIGVWQVDTLPYFDRLYKLLQYALCKHNDIVCLASDVAFALNLVNKFEVGYLDPAKVTLLVLCHIRCGIQLAYIAFLLIVEFNGLAIFERAVQGTGQCPAEKPRLARSLRKMGRTLTCPMSRSASSPRSLL